MKSKSMMLLLVAGGCGLVAMLGVQQMLPGPKSDAPKIKILVAKTEISSGIRLDSTNVTMKEVSADAVPEGGVTSEEQYADRALKHFVAQGQPILLSELGNKGEYGLNVTIPADMRVVSVPVTATMTHSGLLKPGNFVDVNAAVESMGMAGRTQSEVMGVLECVQVFAIDSQVVGSEEAKDPKAKDSKNVSFLLYPRQAQLLHLAHLQSHGNLQFALRSTSDRSVANSADLSDEMMVARRKSLMGTKDEPEKKEVAEKVVAPTKAKNAFRSYVAPETSTAVISVGEQATQPVWTIEIFNGDQREIQELRLTPDEVTGEFKRTSAEASTMQWKNPLMKLTNGDQKKTTAQVDAPSTMSLDQKKDLQAGSEIMDQVTNVLGSAVDEE